MPDDSNEAISLNSCVNICKTFRDTVKGPLALLSYKLQEIENKQSGDFTSADEFDTVDGYPKYIATNDTVVLDPWSDNAFPNAVLAMSFALWIKK